MVSIGCKLLTHVLTSGAVENKACISKFVPYIHVNMITHPCPEPHVDLGNFH